MNIIVNLFNAYAAALPYLLPFIIIGLFIFAKKENKERDELIAYYAQRHDISVKEAKEILYPWK